MTYRCEYVRCGKPGCARCPHGPYWYGYWRDAGKLHKKYYGKKRPQAQGEESVPYAKTAAHPWDAIFNRKTASQDIACAILGVLWSDDWRRIRVAYNHAVLEAHPDKGGSTVAMQRVTAAYAWLKSLHKK